MVKLFSFTSLLPSLIYPRAFSSIDVTELGIVMLVNFPQSKNVFFPMFVTEFGIIILVRLLHPENVSRPVLAILFGSMTLVKPVHPTNAPDIPTAPEPPKYVTESGIIMLVSAVQFANVLFAM